MRPVLAAHPDAMLVIHCAPMDEGGILEELISREPGASETAPAAGTHPQVVLTRAHDTFRGLSDEELNVLYNAADLYVSPTMAEGFGLTLAEAGACGRARSSRPTTRPDPRRSARAPSSIPTVGYITNVYAHEWALVDEPALTAAVERLITRPAARAELSAAGRRHVARLTWDAAAGAFHDLRQIGRGGGIARENPMGEVALRFLQGGLESSAAKGTDVAGDAHPRGHASPGRHSSRIARSSTRTAGRSR